MIESIMPGEAAVLMLAWLERRGAKVGLVQGDFVHFDLPDDFDFGSFTPDQLAQALLSLRDEFRALLRTQRQVH